MKSTTATGEHLGYDIYPLKSTNLKTAKILYFSEWIISIFIQNKQIRYCKLVKKEALIYLLKKLNLTNLTNSIWFPRTHLLNWHIFIREFLHFAHFHSWRLNKKYHWKYTLHMPNWIQTAWVGRKVQKESPMTRRIQVWRNIQCFPDLQDARHMCRDNILPEKNGNRRFFIFW